MSNEDFYPTGVEEPQVEFTREPTPSRLVDFHNQASNVPKVEIKKENPRHRRILFMKAHGMSNRNIAEVLGMTPVGVGLIVRQPWFRESLVQLMNHSGIDGVKNAIQGAALDSVYKIIELRDNAESEAVQRDCAFDILDRYLGKAVQPIGEAGKKTIADETRLDAEITELQKRLGLGAVEAKERN